MVIKANGSELEFSEKWGAYVGLRKKGQLFINQEELSNNIIAELTKIQNKAEDLIKQAEQLLSK